VSRSGGGGAQQKGPKGRVELQEENIEANELEEETGLTALNLAVRHGHVIVLGQVVQHSQTAQTARSGESEREREREREREAAHFHEGVTLWEGGGGRLPNDADVLTSAQRQREGGREGGREGERARESEREERAECHRVELLECEVRRLKAEVAEATEGEVRRLKAELAESPQRPRRAFGGLQKRV
jgi:hypothetical protein